VIEGINWGQAILFFFNVFILCYFLAIQAIYFVLVLLAYWAVLRNRRVLAAADWRRVIQSPLTIPISILAPAYNEEQTIIQSISSLLVLEYPQHEVIVINDGSRDGTMAVLLAHFQLVRVPAQVDLQVPCKPILGIYRSADYPMLTVVDKENGGKADALNAGVNLARYPLFCAIDADSLLEGNALLRVARPFVEHPDQTVAVGGVVRIANGCKVEHGRVMEVDLPQNSVAMFQWVEYVRAFLFGRAGWSSLGALLIISGAFGIFRRKTVIEVGGYRHDTVGEDLELVVRIHRRMCERRIPYRIEFLPDPVCWTEAPETLRILSRQRNRWQRGLLDTLMIHRTMILNPRYGPIGMLAMPYFFLFELIGPIIEILGYLIVPASLLLGIIDLSFFFLFLTVAVLLGVILSVLAVALDDIEFGRLPRMRQVLWLVLFGLLENFGYRQLTSWWRLKGFYDHWRGNKGWGKMERRGFRKNA
jgi:cellulose synthase/poly-beta-1,6-N-acetylglucosamine synthase-like glycosyltransferase